MQSRTIKTASICVVLIARCLHDSPTFHLRRHFTLRQWCNVCVQFHFISTNWAIRMVLSRSRGFAFYVITHHILLFITWYIYSITYCLYREAIVCDRAPQQQMPNEMLARVKIIHHRNFFVSLETIILESNDAHRKWQSAKSWKGISW